MAIKIIDDKPDIHISREEHDRRMQEYQKMCQFMVNPPSFETYLRRYIAKDNHHG